MLKFLHVARISNFLIFLADLSLDFKHVVLFHLDELLSLWYMVEKLQMSSFQPNFNCSKISSLAPDISQTVHESLVWYIWQDSSTNLDHLKYYVLELHLTWKFTIIFFICLIFSCKILTLSNVRFERYVQSGKTS